MGSYDRHHLTTSQAVDGAIAAIAARQHGNITHEQLRRIGLSNHGIQYRVEIGRLFRIHRGVYGVGKPPVTPLEHASAAVLAGGPTAALSHGSAMTLWGYFKHWDAPLEVIVTTDRRPSRIRVHRSTTLAPRDLTSHHGIRVTTPARTLFDIAPRLKPTTRERVVNDALVSPYMSTASLADLLSRHPDAPATRLIAPLMPSGRSGPTRSDLERRFKGFCERFGLPQPIFNVIIAGYLVDAFFPEHGLIVEIDGFDFHSSRTAFERDRDRDADTLLAGFPTVRVTDERIRRSPSKEAARLERLLDRSRRGSRAA